MGDSTEYLEWFLIAGHGDMVVRRRPGMLLGETAADEVTFDPSCGQLELDIDYDGGIVLNAASDYELESAGGTRSRRECLAPYRRAEIRLSHNVLQLDTDFADLVETDDPLEIRIAPLPLEHPAKVDGRAAEEDTVDESVIRTGFRNRRAERTLNPLMAGSIGLAIVGLALLDPGLRENLGFPSPVTVDAVPAPDSDVLLSTVRLPPLPRRLLELAPPIEPIVLSPVAHGSNPSTAEVVDNRPDLVFLKGLEGIGETAQIGPH